MNLESLFYVDSNYDFYITSNPSNFILDVLFTKEA